jgi:predicted deacylase
MKRFILAAAVVLPACGKPSGQSAGVYFVPRAALSSLTGAGLSVVGTHDSGLLVEASTEADKSQLEAVPQSFRFDRSAPEVTLYTFSTMEQKLKALAAAYPQLAKLETYGTSVEGRPEYVLTIGKQDGEPRPELMITGATHGNERATVDVVLGLSDLLLTNYGKDPRTTAMVDGHTIHFIPAVCVDSFVADERANEGRDPNRDYPWPQEPDRRPVHAIKDIMAYFDSHDIVGSLDYHSAASMVMFPWAYTYSHIPAADYARFDDLTTRMARENHFAHGDIASTIYIAQGSSADYYYWKKGTIATAVELSHDLATRRSSHDDLLTESTEMTWTFIENFR